MKKKLTLLVLVILITLVTATTALARHEKQSFTIGGTITIIVGDKITVQTRNGSVTVQVTDSTIFLKWTEDGRVDAIFAEVEDTQSTNIKYTVDVDGNNIASQVTVLVPLYCDP